MNKESDTIIARYKADIFEYRSGRTEISYVCDKDKNKECAKNNCTDECCTHTLDKNMRKTL